MIVLGIESSCDETAAAVVRDGREILSSVVASQARVHHPYGGVVPELASRKHIEAILPTVTAALDQAGAGPKPVDGVAATQGPGLIGSLLVGFSFAKAYAYARGIAWVGVDHLEGHLQSVFLGTDPPAYPFVALLASGGHTAVYHVAGPMARELLGRTRDDAAGEAFDKVAKMLGLGYPGGGVLSRMAEGGDPRKVPFPRAYLDKENFDFSFSGLKTAVNRHLRTLGGIDGIGGEEMVHIAAGFQEAVVDVLCHKIVRAAEVRRCGHLSLVGGVAANPRLRERVTDAAAGSGIRVHIPPVELCGDNAAMIAAAGYHRLAAGERAPLDADVYSRSP